MSQGTASHMRQLHAAAALAHRPQVPLAPPFYILDTTLPALNCLYQLLVRVQSMYAASRGCCWSLQSASATFAFINRNNFQVLSNILCT